MTIEIAGYTRMPFRVDAVQVTKENINEVAQWCGGAVHSTTKVNRDENQEETGRVKVPFVKVDVHRPLNDRQTKAFIGDWILKSDSGYKVYTEKAFDKSFQKEVVYTEVDAINHNKDFPEPTRVYTEAESLATLNDQPLPVNGITISTDAEAVAQVSI